MVGDISSSSFVVMVAIAAFSSLVSSVIPLIWYRNGVKKSTLHALLGISAGILFAIATIDLIPEGIAVSSMVSGEKNNIALANTDKPKTDDAHNHDHHDEEAEMGRKITMIGVGIGFLALVLLEQLMLSMGVAHSHGPDDMDDDGHSHAHNHPRKNASGLSDSFSLTAFAALAVHSLVDGIVIGGSFRVSSVIGARVAVAIVLHKIPDGFVVASLLAASNRSNKWMWVAFLSSVTPFGAMMGKIFFVSLSFSDFQCRLFYANWDSTFRSWWCFGVCCWDFFVHFGLWNYS